MAYHSLFLCFLVLILIVEQFSCALGDVTERTNNRCTNICKEESAKVAQSHQIDCQRGCRYFNIEFLTAGTSDEESSKSSLENLVLGRCRTLCTDAYPSDGMRRDACNLGCRRMFEIQEKAPVATGGFLVYMGAGERSMVVMQQPPDLLENAAQSGDNEWVLLNSIFRPSSHDYNELPSTYKLTETHVQTMPISADRHRFGEYRRMHPSFCIPAWLWLIPVMLLMALVYIQYGSTLKNVLVLENEESDDELEHEIIVETRKELDNELAEFSMKDKDTFLISFQPLDFLEAKLQDLPPKYEASTSQSSLGN